MSLWNGVDNRKVSEAKKEGYDIISSVGKKAKSILDELKEYAEYIEKHGFITGVSKKLADKGSLDDITNNVMKVHDGVQRLQPLLPDNIAISNYSYNKKIDLSSYKNGYINDQNSGVVSELKFGVTTMDKNGCGVIATYNAMKILDKPKDIRDIAYHYEKDGQVLGGLFGTNPYSIKRYFELGGYKVKTIEGENITKGNLPDADAYIVSFWNSDNAMESIHTVAMRKTSDGKYELFNYKSNNQNNSIKDKDFADLLEFEGNIPLALYCISK